MTNPLQNIDAMLTQLRMEVRLKLALRTLRHINTFPEPYREFYLGIYRNNLDLQLINIKHNDRRD